MNFRLDRDADGRLTDKGRIQRLELLIQVLLVCIIVVAVLALI